MKTVALDHQRMQGTNFGPLLKHWRQRKRLSQLSLALASDVSQRHISFLESGRAMPSREMIVRIATQLDVPLRYRNELLLAAGFAPLYSESQWNAPDLEPARRAVELILARQDPYPAVVLDRLWNIRLANTGAKMLFRRLSNMKPVTNLLLASFDPESLRPSIENWDFLAAHLRQRICQESQTHGTSHAFNQIIAQVKLLDPCPPPGSTGEVTDPLVSISVRKGSLQLRLFSTITTLGTPGDITLQETRIESFFPVDESSARQLRSLTARTQDSA